MAESKNANYTKEVTEKLLDLYSDLGTENLDKIAEIIEKPIKSVRSKLVRLGVYIPLCKQDSKASSPSKKQLLRNLEAEGFNADGFEGATKDALSRLLKTIQS